jgi:hypothetical protein
MAEDWETVVEIPEHRWEQRVTQVVEEGKGCLVTFACGHRIWWAIPPVIGRVWHCSACFDEFLKSLKEQRSEP